MCFVKGSEMSVARFPMRRLCVKDKGPTHRQVAQVCVCVCVWGGALLRHSSSLDGDNTVIQKWTPAHTVHRAIGQRKDTTGRAGLDVVVHQ